MENKVPGAIKVGRYQLKHIVIFLVAIFIIPYASAWLFYFATPLWQNHTTNRGELINPPLALPDLSLRKDDGYTFTANDLKGQWTLLYVNHGECGLDCQNNLYKIRQIRLVLGKNKNRIQRILATDENTTKLTKLLSTEYDGTKRLHLDKEKDKNLSGLYIIDPVGNVIMNYQPNCTPNAIYEDLRHLLQVSQIG